MKTGRPAAKDDSFTAFVIDQLEGLGAVEARRLFGGRGLYFEGEIFGLIDEGQVFFRVSEATAPRYEAEGSKPFEPWPGHVMKGYWELPARVLEDADEAVAWARQAWTLPRARAAKGARPKATPRKTARRSAGPRPRR